MDPPPAYPTHLTIPDLRAQIIANSTIIYPHREVTKAADSHLELVVANWIAIFARYYSLRCACSQELRQGRYQDPD